MRLKNKRAVITGGTAGFGFEMARRYIEEGAHVVITGRKQERVDAAVAKLGKNAKGVAADATSNAELDKLAKEVKKGFENVDILIANAGNVYFAPVAESSEEGYYSQFDLNVKGVFFTVQKILPLLKKGSTIILVSSGVNSKGLPNASLYAATKAAIRSFGRSMAAEFASKGIRVNCLSPGLVHTDIFSSSNLGEGSFKEFEEKFVNSVALGRAGTSLEIANAAVFLGSDESSYMNGSDLVVDGGWKDI